MYLNIVIVHKESYFNRCIVNIRVFDIICTVTDTDKKCWSYKIFPFKLFIGAARHFKNMAGLIKVKCDGQPARRNKDTRLLVNAGNNVVYIDKATIVDTVEPRTDSPAAVDVEIKTNLAVLFPKKLKFAFALNVLLALLSIFISLTFGYLYWIQMELMKEQINMIIGKYNISESRSHQESARHLIHAEPEVISAHYPVPKVNNFKTPNKDIIQNVDIGSQDIPNITSSLKDLFVVQFNGAQHEVNLGSDPIIGPWVRDLKVSSPESHTKIELNEKYVIIKEGGLYLIYAQVVYLTNEPSCFLIWTRHSAQNPKMLATCATSGSNDRPLAQSQISCSVQIMARLYEDDVVNIAQRERNKTVWLRPGYSYFGFIKLGS
ncbi:uncharacterized protein LOC113510228 [Galleria mellonella]|uniref:Uncharacterized protein LOC113510228 n=1 Tax=Galleria mellonella TaxID=7137 RepID=A0ABM3N2U2_GALME|nr:uncharacterized protein LOC113510228 [Galleria mellonella]